eukprot:1394370-Amorphochlora_amoeboformis.AAC.2
MAQEYLGLMAPTRRRKARIRVLALALIASALVLTISVAKFQLSLRYGLSFRFASATAHKSFCMKTAGVWSHPREPGRDAGEVLQQKSTEMPLTCLTPSDHVVTAKVGGRFPCKGVPVQGRVAHAFRRVTFIV